MGKVTEELTALVARQVRDHGIVVWYDPEQAYGEVLDHLNLPDTTVVRFTDSFFRLRYQIEPFLEFVEEDGRLRPGLATPPKLLIYIPLDRAKTQHAMIEAETLGVVMEPGASPWQRNTRLKVLAERVFKRISPDRADAVVAEVEAGRRTLAELDWLAGQTGELGALKLVFGRTAVTEVIPAFLSTNEYDEAILKKNALPELTALCETDLGLPVEPDRPLEQVRRQLCRALLLAELKLLVQAAGGDASGLDAVHTPEAARQQEQIRAVCRSWRNRLDLRETYAEWAGKVQAEAHVAGLGLNAPVLVAVETFPYVESLLLGWVESLILKGSFVDALEIVERRKSSFWSLQEGGYRLRWALLEIAARFFPAADRIEAELKAIKKDARAMVQAYTGGITGASGEPPVPWCILDQYQRHLEHRYAMLDLQPCGSPTQLEKVMLNARRRYVDVVGRCAESFAKALAAADFNVDGAMAQDHVFPRRVRARAAEGKTAYILVDALRYEMALELVNGFGDEFQAAVSPAVAQLPTITEVGMAALMPGADGGMELVDAGSGKVGIRINDTLLKDRGTRVKHFESEIAGRSLVLKLNELMKPAKKRQQEIAGADVLLITSQEIDRRGEEAEDGEEARRFMDEVLEKLRRGVRRLALLGVRRIILTADHGHLLLDDLDDAMKIGSPGGRTVDLHPRLWIGRGGSAAPGYIRVKASELGLAGDLELAFPLGLACFRTRGSSRGYFHGGISLQEMVVPVAEITVKDVRAHDKGASTVVLTFARPKITTRFFSVEVTYVVQALFGEDTKRVKMVVRTNRSEAGMAAMAAYGFEEGTREIVLEKDRPNAVTMMLTGEVDAPAVSVHVLDAATLVELAVLKNIPVKISI